MVVVSSLLAGSLRPVCLIGGDFASLRTDTVRLTVYFDAHIGSHGLFDSFVDGWQRLRLLIAEQIFPVMLGVIRHWTRLHLHRQAQFLYRGFRQPIVDVFAVYVLAMPLFSRPLHQLQQADRILLVIVLDSTIPTGQSEAFDFTLVGFPHLIDLLAGVGVGSCDGRSERVKTEEGEKILLEMGDS